MCPRGPSGRTWTRGAFGAVWSSDAVRARQTASAIAGRLGLRVIVTPDLAEVALGSAEGSTDPAVLRQAAGALKAWLAARVTAALTRIAGQCAGRAAIVVGHVASLTVGISELCGNGPSLWGLPLPHATPVPLTREGAEWHVEGPAGHD